MSGAHGHALYVHAGSPLHRLAPQVKIVGALLFLFAVVSTPRQAFWAFAIYALVLGALAALSRIPIRFLLSRMLVAGPFVLLALLFPIVGSGPRVDVIGLSLSQAGLWDMWNLLAKSLLGLLTAIVLGATTEVADLLRGLSALRVPGLVTSILGFMVRYLDVIIGDLTRMRLALAARGHQGSTVRHWGPYGRAIGTMFIRTYERGERVYLSMESRGYAGEMPASSRVIATPWDWAITFLVAGGCWTVAIMARITT
ncbi:MAG: cobalt ECF transporter T component CbiQ [Actinomycetota bacterium]|nr:cobalt ECF transporter T component CbiQ [Actinomycetota bacterium]